ncbi:4-hydroxy-tetrahydrodipicolinate synthase [compost metagenome]
MYSGDDSAALPAMSVGGYGIISVASHLVGVQMKQMLALFQDGHVKEAATMHQELLPMFKGLFECPNPVAVKYALNELGYPVGTVRLPLVPPTQEEAERIRKLLK